MTRKGWRQWVWHALMPVLSVLGPGAALAQTAAVNVSYLEGQNPVAPDAVTSYGPDLFGDRVNLFNGGLEFEHTDLSLPGNNSLPVAVGRKHTPGRSHVVRGQFGDWDLEVPRIGGTFTIRSGWLTRTGGLDRCSGYSAPPSEPRDLGVTANAAGTPATGPGSAAAVAPPDEPDAVSAVAFSASDFWQGTSLTVPGQGSQELLLRAPSYLSAPADGNAYPLVTRQNWAIGCLPSVQNASGEGFIALSPQGVRYRFDWMAARVHPNVKKSGGSLGRQEMFLMATLVTDRFGNWVRYSYDPANPLLLTRIESSDGRVITITNANGRASSASDGTRTFVYSYGSRGELSTVTQPDGSRWTFDLTPMVPANLPNLGESANCDSPGDFYADILTGRIVHPSGAEAVFTTQFWKFGRTYVNRVCWYAPGSTTVTTGAVWPRQVTSQALMSKQITGPGLATLSWSYAYNAPGGWSTCTTGTCILPRTVTVTEPTGGQTRHTFGSRWRVDEGQLQKVDEGWNAATGKALKTTSYRYRNASGQAFAEQFGTSPQQNSDWLASRNRPQDQRVVSLQSSTFTWQVDTTSAGFDVYARPRKATKSSSLGHTRTEATVYADYPAWWVMGQLASVTEQSTGRLVETHAYDAKAQRTATYRFGQLVQSFAYNADGTLASVSDAANQVTRLANHKRGKPQRVTHPDGASESQVINNLGNADSRTNAVGGTTQFGYDAMGRVSLVVPPAGDAVAYHPTYQTFEQVGALEFGLQPGHWRQTISTGNARTVRYFDALWRERLEGRYDTARPSTTSSYEETRYDVDGRKSFESYPERTFTVVDASRPGRSTWYDAIDRPVRQVASSELGDLESLTTYPSTSFTRTVSNPRRKLTTFSFQAFDEPVEDSIKTITAPEGVTISIARDVFGKPSSITRSGGGATATRRYVYDPQQRLCKTIEPETGSTVQAYTVAGDVMWRASGLSLPSVSSCDQASVSAARKVNFTYDSRRRLTQTTYGDGSPAVTRTYTADGLPQTLSTDLFGWTLGYNNRRLLTSETLNSPFGAYAFGYGVEAHGHVDSMAYPGGPTLTYAPDALGRPTQVSGYARSISHHPNGQLAGYTADNGVVHSIAQNLRGLPQSVRYTGVAQDAYTYDENGNVLGITDQQQGLATRSMGYDGLDRLTVANGTWGAGRYSYDALDNMRSSVVGSRSLTHNYDSVKNRLTSVTGSLNASLAYDANGNLVQRAGQGFVFDVGNRLTSATNIASYFYDGHGRRAGMSTPAGRVVVRAYSQTGRLLLTQDTAKGITRHIHLGDKVIAEHNSQTGAIWLHTDTLGSPIASTGPTGAVLERTRYEPYGIPAAGVTRDGIGFTGHVNDVDTGLVYMQQRYYDPVAARFLSVDPVTTDTKEGHHFNRYVYAENNPYKYRDPDGKAVETPWDAANVAIGAASLVRNVASGNLVGAAVDVVGIFIDVAATAAPGVPGGAATAIQAVRAADKAGDTARAAIPKPGTGKGAVPPSDRDPKRLYTRDEVTKGLGKQGGECAGCGKRLDAAEAVGHHTQRHADGGKTNSENLTVVCNPCHKDLHKPD